MTAGAPDPGTTPGGAPDPTVGAPTPEPCTLTAAYERCRQLHRRHGTTYYLATLLLPAWKRRHVHALYGFARYADEIVDDLGSCLGRAEQAAALRRWGRRFFTGLRGAPCDDPVLPDRKSVV